MRARAPSRISSATSSARRDTGSSWREQRIETAVETVAKTITRVARGMITAIGEADGNSENSIDLDVRESGPA